MTAGVLAGGVVLVVVVWIFMFTLPREGLWTRTWIGAGTVIAYATAAIIGLDRWTDVIDPLDVEELGIGLAAGIAWLLATHLGATVLQWLVPGFGEQIADLYRATGERRTAYMFGAVVAMGVAEELMFRGLLQDHLGLVAATAIYAAAQAVERKWVLVLAALLGGAVWGGLFAWREAILAPIVAHVVWTGALTFVWPIRTDRRIGVSVPGQNTARR